MSAAGRAERPAGFRLRFPVKRITSSRLSEWRWRLAGVLLLLAYLVQDAAGLRWEWLAQLQTVDLYKYVTGSCLLAYVCWQWCLFLARQRGMRVHRLMALHQRSGVVAPVLFYLHSVQIGYGYLAVLSWVLLTNVIVGVASPVGIRIHNRAYTAFWVVMHVLLAALTIILGLFHAYIAVYYK